ncbi:hypothetical protein BS50DRAFT_500505 [Corynespora cassiicola Philippines]|uniref:Uncharacterized protein n=1 Tax=Corynespora cassiicola Philippines TaxID=1448308 RepID=A0A2T2NDY8_CORCC|nr:hypothetical protein BS50DRAFT_500505 [Corynespora cassiicola Philippines]
MNDFSHGVHPFESGKIRDKLDIPELVNMTLLRQNDSLIYDIPEEGIDISPELYEEITGHAPKPWNKRDCSNPCNCGTYRQYSLTNADWSRFYGDIRSVSSPLCGPGSITKTFTLSYSYTISGSFGANAGPTDDIIRSLGIPVGFTYTWGNAIATGYTTSCMENHPCIATFKPWMGMVRGRGRWTELSNSGNKLCASGIGGNIEVRLPIVRECTNDHECGADGVWGQCYFVGGFAQASCSNLGPTPGPGAQCPASLYPN